jgi:transcriptional regulator with XRE-family HTH domain
MSPEDPVLPSRTHPIPGSGPPTRAWTLPFLAGFAVTGALLAGPVAGVRALSEATSPPQIQPAQPPVQPAPLVSAGPAQSTSTIVRDLHARSGLTWEQLGRLLGVSRRAVHLWAAGGRVNSRHLELLTQLRGIIDGLPAENASQRRTLIFQAHQTGPSIFDTFLRQHTGEEGVVAGTPFSPDELLGARYDEVEGE